jgi:hypothetical protein
MRTRIAIAIAIAVAGQIFSVPAYAGVRRALLSVDGLGLSPREAITAFHIETWGVEFLAVCRLPKSWELKSEKFEDPEGWLDGEADTHGERLNRLSNMYLVDIYDYQPQPRGDPKSDYHPPSFAGWVRIGNVEASDGGAGRKRTLKASDFRLKDARNCPVPPAQQK